MNPLNRSWLFRKTTDEQYSTTWTATVILSGLWGLPSLFLDAVRGQFGPSSLCGNQLELSVRYHSSLHSRLLRWSVSYVAMKFVNRSKKGASRCQKLGWYTHTGAWHTVRANHSRPDAFSFGNGQLPARTWVQVAHTTGQIWQALKSRGITRKVLEVHAKEQDEIRRQNFLKMTSVFTAEQRFYVDERYKCNYNFNLEAFDFTTISLRIQLLRNSSISMLPIYLATSFLSQDISIVLPLFLLDLLSSSYYFFLLCLNLNNLQILSNTKLASDFSL